MGGAPQSSHRSSSTLSSAAKQQPVQHSDPSNNKESQVATPKDQLSRKISRSTRSDSHSSNIGYRSASGRRRNSREVLGDVSLTMQMHNHPEIKGSGGPLTTSKSGSIPRPVGGTDKLGTFSGVFVPTTLNVLSILMFLRFGFILGQSGVVGMMGRSSFILRKIL